MLKPIFYLFACSFLLVLASCSKDSNSNEECGECVTVITSQIIDDWHWSHTPYEDLCLPVDSALVRTYEMVVLTPDCGQKTIEFDWYEDVKGSGDEMCNTQFSIPDTIPCQWNWWDHLVE